MSEAANQDDEGAEDAPAPTVEASPSPSPAQAKADLLAELLEDAPDPTSLRGPAAAAHADPRLGTRVGQIVEWVSGSAPRVEFPGNELGPLAARSVIPLDPTLVAEAIANQRGVMLSFEDGRPEAPIITGLLQPLVFETEIELETETGTETGTETEAGPDSDADGITPMLAEVDGRRVDIKATDEIVLRCGEASIVLRRNGRVVIRGTYVETRSRGVNRIKGGSVQIN